MGCGCKDDSISGSTIEVTKTLGQKINKILFRENKFSFFGLVIFVLFVPIITVFILPMTYIILFNKLVLGKNTDLVNLLVFKKNKKMKK